MEQGVQDKQHGQDIHRPARNQPVEAPDNPNEGDRQTNKHPGVNEPKPLPTRDRHQSRRSNLFFLFGDEEAEAIRRYVSAHPEWERLRVPKERHRWLPRLKSASRSRAGSWTHSRPAPPPWRRPWSNLENTGSPANVVSKRSYTGVNTLLLELVAQERGWSNRWWGTFRQWQELGLRIKARPSTVKPGEWGTRIVFCKAVAKKPAQERNGEEKGREDQANASRFFLLRTYCVIHAEQVEGDGIEKYLARPRTTTTFENYTPAEGVIAATNARIEFGGSKAAYYPEADFIRLPEKDAFESEKEYYATAFHELIHFTGHENRLARLNKNARFGDAAYAVEELVAEIGGCFLCNEVGLKQSDDLSNQAAYLASWLKVLQADPSAIFTAASQASAAVDYILRFSRKDDQAGQEGDAAAAGVCEREV